MLADGPELDPAAVERVVAAWRESGAPIVAASYGGEPRPPPARRPVGLGGHPRRRGCARTSRCSSPATTSAHPATSTTLTISRKGSGRHPTNRCRCRCSSSTPHPRTPRSSRDRSPLASARLHRRLTVEEVAKRAGADAGPGRVARGRARLPLPFGGQRDRGDAAGRRRARDRPARGAQAGRAVRCRRDRSTSTRPDGSWAWPRSPRR